jgi:Mg-chelatase subunit ChlD
MGMPHPSTTVSMAASSDLITIARSSAAELYVVITLQATGTPVETDRPSIAACFVLDTSGSMSGQPLTQAVDSTVRLAKLLAPTDRAALVAFSTNASVDLPLTTVNTAGQQQLKRRLEALKADGNTSLSKGLMTGKGLFASRRDNERQLLMVLTDGAATDGTTLESLLQFGDSCRPNIAVTALGYGPGHNVDMLKALAKGAGGEYIYIADPAPAGLQFARALGAQVDTVADGGELWLAPAGGVEVAEVLGEGNLRFGQDGLRVPIPNLLADQPHTVVIKLAVKASAEAINQQLLLRCLVNYRAAGNSVPQSSRCDVNIAVKHNAADAGTMDAATRGLVVLALAQQLRQAAMAHADQQRFDAAAKLLRDAIALIESVPGYKAADGSPLSESVEQLIDEAVIFERRPTATQYHEYKGHAGGIDIGQARKFEKTKASRGAALVNQHLDPDVEGEVTIEHGGQTTMMPLRSEMSIGRGLHNDITVASSQISRTHVKLSCQNGTIVISDLGTSNGMLVNGHKVSVAQLANNDVIVLGDVTIKINRRR